MLRNIFISLVAAVENTVKFRFISGIQEEIGCFRPGKGIRKWPFSIRNSGFGWITSSPRFFSGKMQKSTGLVADYRSLPLAA
jgi:hypothetical protein